MWAPAKTIRNDRIPIPVISAGYKDRFAGTSGFVAVLRHKVNTVRRAARLWCRALDDANLCQRATLRSICDVVLWRF